jgi:predicted transport protein
VKYTKLKHVSLKSHPELNEAWVQNIIADDPSILGLGDVVLRDKERQQPRAGRLDILLQDADSNRRYEVEIQLGDVDESHIIRTIEYWDIERKRYPQYEHCGVIVAENITSRFLNVIGLFNGMIPLIAIQMTAIETDGGMGLSFIKVLDEMVLGMTDEDEAINEPTDRAFWENKRSNKKIVAIADKVLELAKQIKPALELKYNKYYIGMAANGVADNFATYTPKKSYMHLSLKLRKSEEVSEKLEESGLSLMDYSRHGRYRIVLNGEDVATHSDLLRELLQMAHDQRNG